jgi:hypothetical protein
MNSLFLSLLSSFVVSSVFSQFSDFGCDHYSLLPTDVCIGFGSYDYYYMCNGSDIMEFMTYASGDCGTTDAQATLKVSLDLTSSIYSGLAECGTGDSCGYFAVSCSDTWYATVLTDVCYAYTSSSYMYSCSSSVLTAMSYTGSNDCSGSSISASVDYSSSTYSYGTDCDYFCVSGSSGSGGDSGTTGGTTNMMPSTTGMGGSSSSSSAKKICLNLAFVFTVAFITNLFY